MLDQPMQDIIDEAKSGFGVQDEESQPVGDITTQDTQPEVTDTPSQDPSEGNDGSNAEIQKKATNSNRMRTRGERSRVGRDKDEPGSGGLEGKGAEAAKDKQDKGKGRQITATKRLAPLLLAPDLPLPTLQEVHRYPKYPKSMPSLAMAEPEVLTPDVVRVKLHCANSDHRAINFEFKASKATVRYHLFF